MLILLDLSLGVQQIRNILKKKKQINKQKITSSSSSHQKNNNILNRFVGIAVPFFINNEGNSRLILQTYHHLIKNSISRHSTPNEP